MFDGLFVLCVFACLLAWLIVCLLVCLIACACLVVLVRLFD